MRIDVKFSEKDCSFAPGFGEVQVVSGDTGGYSQAEMDAAVAAATEAGKQAENDRFWDTFQDNGKRANYRYAFNGPGWNDDTFAPKYDIVPGVYDYTTIFQYSTITDLKGILEKCGVVLDLTQTSGANSTFADMPNNTRLPKIDYGHITGNHYAVCSKCPKLVEIEEYVVNEKAKFTQVFDNCTSLTTIKMSGTIGNAIAFPQSSLLSAQSVQSVIDCLKDLTGQTAQTLTFHADVGANMTEAQKATITAKNWTLVY